MKKSQLTKNPRRVAGKKLMRRFNHFPTDLSAGRYIAVSRFANPEAIRLALAVAERTTVAGWFECNEELMALYSNGDALILFDRYVDNDGVLDTVISVASGSLEELDRVAKILIRHAPTEWDEQLLLEFGND